MGGAVKVTRLQAFVLSKLATSGSMPINCLSLAEMRQGQGVTANMAARLAARQLVSVDGRRIVLTESGRAVVESIQARQSGRSS
jgi:hypothetical protein